MYHEFDLKKLSLDTGFFQRKVNDVDSTKFGRPGKGMEMMYRMSFLCM